MTHFSPGMSNKLVSPVQLMSSFWEEIRRNRVEQSLRTDSKPIAYKTIGHVLLTEMGVGRCNKRRTNGGEL